MVPVTATLVPPPVTDVRPSRLAGLRGRFVGGLRDTPRRLAAVLAGLVALGFVVGVVGFTGVRQRADLIDGVTSRSGALVVAAQNLYRALSDADATAASAFLSGGVEPAAQRDRYQNGVAEAAAALAVIAAGRSGDGARDGAVGVIAAELPVYTGLIETARAYNRQGLPVGAAYLREASGLMRQRMLPAAQQLYQSVTAELDQARGGGAGFPWIAVLLGLVTIAALVRMQMWLTRRTNRVFNIGLVGATAAAVVLVGWLGVSAVVIGTRLDASDRDGSAQVDRLVQARVAALQARADESLTLVARGAGGDFDKDYTAVMTRLIGPDGHGGLLRDAAERAADEPTRAAADRAAGRARDWLAAHQKLRQLDDGGQYTEAVTAAVGSDPGATTSIFNQLDDTLASAITRNSDRFEFDARSARRGLSGMDLGVVVLTGLIVIGSAAGIQRRIAEYR
ncbi:hypothetical protein DLE60_30260 [Micromonospora globispora]|uniref:Secreted protein n=1 Tax=Micromonospora globispora TaxID=1450148 RepID=A0A317KJQ8_9ACTN|nr:hypothetical protein DLE60_30260 [Micromonospora globispora]PWU54073.1 hypothetical protein DLJ46_00145 [Micromonospora globispora]RQX05888.1 hypothetical protein DKL51_02035 [Micromonospora globispora]